MVNKKEKEMENTISEEMITITKKEYDELLNQIRFLYCLEAAGVDNWDGYDYAQELRDEDE